MEQSTGQDFQTQRIFAAKMQFSVTTKVMVTPDNAQFMRLGLSWPDAIIARARRPFWLAAASSFDMAQRGQCATSGSGSSLAVTHVGPPSAWPILPSPRLIALAQVIIGFPGHIPPSTGIAPAEPSLAEGVTAFSAEPPELSRVASISGCKPALVIILPNYRRLDAHLQARHEQNDQCRADPFSAPQFRPSASGAARRTFSVVSGCARSISAAGSPLV